MGCTLMYAMNPWRVYPSTVHGMGCTLVYRAYNEALEGIDPPRLHRIDYTLV